MMEAKLITDAELKEFRDSQFGQEYVRHRIFLHNLDDYNNALVDYQKLSFLRRLFTSSPIPPDGVSRDELQNLNNLDVSVRNLEDTMSSLTYVDTETEGKIYCKCRKNGAVEVHVSIPESGGYAHQGTLVSLNGFVSPVKVGYPKSEVIGECRINSERTAEIYDRYERLVTKMQALVTGEKSFLNRYNNAVQRVISQQERKLEEERSRQLDDLVFTWQDTVSVVFGNVHDKKVFNSAMASYISSYMVSKGIGEDVLERFVKTDTFKFHLELKEEIRDSYHRLHSALSTPEKDSLDKRLFDIEENNRRQDRKKKLNAVCEEYGPVLCFEKNDTVLKKLTDYAVSINAAPEELYLALPRDDNGHVLYTNDVEALECAISDYMCSAYEKRICSAMSGRDGFLPLNKKISIAELDAEQGEMLSSGIVMNGNLNPIVVGVYKRNDTIGKVPGYGISSPTVSGYQQICSSAEFMALEQKKQIEASRKTAQSNSVEKKDTAKKENGPVMQNRPPKKKSGMRI